MCLAIPALIKSIDGYLAEVEIGGLTRQASLQLTPEARVGDYVLLHTGYAISIIDQREAAETLKLLEEIVSQPDDYGQRPLYTPGD
jgi:hydrogenase expression/formation protein HypC